MGERESYESVWLRMRAQSRVLFSHIAPSSALYCCHPHRLQHETAMKQVPQIHLLKNYNTGILNELQHLIHSDLIETKDAKGYVFTLFLSYK